MNITGHFNTSPTNNEFSVITYAKGIYSSTEITSATAPKIDTQSERSYQFSIGFDASKGWTGENYDCSKKLIFILISFL